MSTNLNYKQVSNVTRRTWDVETYEKRAKARQEADEQEKALDNNAAPIVTADDAAEEFRPAEPGAAGPTGSKRAFLKARSQKVDIESKVGTTELVSTEAAATSSSDNGVIQTGIGWHCKVCDCFLKDSHTYLDHINGKKHQRKLGFSMRVERSSKESVLDTLKQLTKKKEDKSKDEVVEETNYEDIVKAKDQELQRRKEERARKRKERKKRAAQPEPDPADDDGDNDDEEKEEEQVEAEGIDPAMAAMMGFSGFGGGNKNG